MRPTPLTALVVLRSAASATEAIGAASEPTTEPAAGSALTPPEPLPETTGPTRALMFTSSTGPASHPLTAPGPTHAAEAGASFVAPPSAAPPALHHPRGLVWAAVHHPEAEERLVARERTPTRPDEPAPALGLRTSSTLAAEPTTLTLMATALAAMGTRPGTTIVAPIRAGPARARAAIIVIPTRPGVLPASGTAVFTALRTRAALPGAAIIVVPARPGALAPPRATFVTASPVRAAGTGATILVAPRFPAIAPTLHAPLDLHPDLVITAAPAHPLLAGLGPARSARLGERSRRTRAEQQSHQTPREELLHRAFLSLLGSNRLPAERPARSCIAASCAPDVAPGFLPFRQVDNSACR